MKREIFVIALVSYIIGHFTFLNAQYKGMYYWITLIGIVVYVSICYEIKSYKNIFSVLAIVLLAVALVGLINITGYMNGNLGYSELFTYGLCPFLGGNFGAIFSVIAGEVKNRKAKRQNNYSQNG